MVTKHKIDLNRFIMFSLSCNYSDWWCLDSSNSEYDTSGRESSYNKINQSIKIIGSVQFLHCCHHHDSISCSFVYNNCLSGKLSASSLLQIQVKKQNIAGKWIKPWLYEILPANNWIEYCRGEYVFHKF